MSELWLFRAFKEVGDKKAKQNKALHPRQLSDFSLCSGDIIERGTLSGICTMVCMEKYRRRTLK